MAVGCKLVLCVALAHFYVQVFAISDSAVACAEDHSRDAEDWFALSGESLIAQNARDRIPGLAIDLQAEQRLALQFARAERQLRGCWARGGRYWQTRIDVIKYLHTIWSVLPPDAWEDAEEFQARMKRLPHKLLAGLCAPPACNQTEITEIIAPRYLSWTLWLVVDLPPPKQDDVDAQEVTWWSNLLLDFVIAGAGNCGTTSLYRNLMQNPDIEFRSSAKEDTWFKRNRLLLPYKADVEAFNAARFSGRSKKFRVYGLEDSSLFIYKRIRLLLASMPHLRAVVVVCDPLGRYEKSFWRDHLCHGGMQADETGRCWSSAAAALWEPELLAQVAIGDHLRDFQQLMGSRLLLLHQDSLRFAPRATFDAIAAFLGARRFPGSVGFRRWNSQRGHRTDLCRNASLVEALQSRLAPEYEALEEVLTAAGVAIPPSLQLRQTRCDRAEELSET